MSLGGIAIAIGAMVDGAIVMIENAHKHLERDRGKKPHWDIIIDAAREVGPALFFSLMIIARRVPAGICTDRPVGANVRAARLHQDLLDGCRRTAVDYHWCRS